MEIIVIFVPTNFDFFCNRWELKMLVGHGPLLCNIRVWGEDFELAAGSKIGSFVYKHRTKIFGNV